ncbi:MAG: hypothetical protein ABW094_11650 [Candidatus Thiodiazotropha sp.]
MIPVKDSFSIVVLGAWNPLIFSPEWILKNITHTDESKITLAYAVDDPEAPRKLSFDGINLLPSKKSLQIIPDTPHVDPLIAGSEFLVRILDLLEHTPIFATGINFAFTENTTIEQINNALNASDSGSILDNYQIKGTSLQRKLQRDNDEHVLNFSLSENEKSHTLNFNFHYETPSAQDCRNIFEGNMINNHHTEAVTFCKDIYGIEEYNCEVA